MPKLKKILTSEKIKAACGHEYRAGILHQDEQDLNEQRAILSQMECLDCIEEKQDATDGHRGQKDSPRTR